MSIRLEKGAQRTWLLPLLLVLIGVAVRLWQLGGVPCGLNQDEAYAGYEAYSMLTYGVDSWGYSNPCYFISWGSGMNVLESYLAMPFVALLGLTELAIRLPQAILACVSLPVVYLLLTRLFSRRVGLIGLFLTAICPWHIMLSRWGLESNLAPGLLLLGLYFLVRGLDSPPWLLLAALFYGLSLYAYATLWVVLPLTLAAFFLYLLYTKRLTFTPYLAGAVGLLFVMALPLLLFVLVNLGVLEEIRTPFLSVPRLVSMRASEVDWRNLFSLEAYQTLGEMVFGEGDGLIWNSLPQYGMFYRFSWPFMILGGVRMAVRAGKGLKARQFTGEGLLLLGLLCAALVSLSLDYRNINKANSLHLYLLVLLAFGVDWVFDFSKAHPVLPWGVVAVYAVAFGLFVNTYFTTYNDDIDVQFRYGVGDAVAYVRQQGFESVAVDSTVVYSHILFYDQTPQPEFAQTVEYANYPSPYLSVSSFGRYTFGVDMNDLGPNTAYILHVSSYDAFRDAGYAVEEFGLYGVAYLE